MKKILLTLILTISIVATYATPTITQFTISNLSSNQEFVRLSNNPQDFTATFTVMRGLAPGSSQWENIACAVTVILLDKNYKEKKELSTPYTFITNDYTSNYQNKVIPCKINQTDIQPGDQIGIKIKYDDGKNVVSNIYGTRYKIQGPTTPGGGEPGSVIGGPNGTIGIYSWRWKDGGSNTLQPYKDANLENWTLNRLEFYAYAQQQPGTVPIYIFKGSYDDDKSSFIYEWGKDQESFWTFQTIKFYAYSTHVPGTVPIYRYTNDQGRDHYYSAQNINIGAPENYDKYIAFYAYPPFKELLDLTPSASEFDRRGNRPKPRTGQPNIIIGPRPSGPGGGGGGRGGRN